MPHLAKDFRLSHHLQTATSIIIPGDVIERTFRQAVLDPRTGCWNYMPSNGNRPTTGYPNLNWGGKAHTIFLHRLSLIYGTDAPAPELRLLALHGCGNSRCVNYNHIRWGTAAENSADYWMPERIRRLQEQDRPARLVVRPRRWPVIACDAIAA